jgi:superfamily II DNA or RNA helicase
MVEDDIEDDIEDNIEDNIEDTIEDDDIEDDDNNNFQDCIEQVRLEKLEKKENIDYQANKFDLCVLATQSGKTFTATAKINIEIELDINYGKSIHLVCTMNTLLNGKQFSKRLESIEKENGKGSVVILASKYTGQYRHISRIIELQGLLLDKKTCPRVVVMCSNHTRYSDCVKFMQVLEENPTNIKRAFVYYDELHQYINREVRKQIELIHNLNITTGIYALTATPDKIWQSLGFWSRLKLHYFDDYNDENYIGFEDMKFNNVDDYYSQPYVKPSPFEFALKAQQTVGFARHVLEQ